MGLTGAGDQPCLGWFNKEAPKLVKWLNSGIKEKLVTAEMHDFTWSSIEVNVNTVSRKQRDSNNEGPSLIATVGAYKGGEFSVEGDVKIDLKGKIWALTGMTSIIPTPSKGIGFP